MNFTPVGFTFKRPETLSPIACETLLHNMGVSDPEKLFDGSMSDKEVIESIFQLYKMNPNIDKSKFGDKYEALCAPKIRKYFDKLKQNDYYLANNPMILEAIKENCARVYNSGYESDDKKKQITA